MSERNSVISRDPAGPPDLPTVDGVGFRDLDPDGVIEQPFWERYNEHYEAPLGWSLAVLLFVLAVVGMVLLPTFGRSRDTKPVPVTSVGEDDAGTGSAGSGQDAPLALGQLPTQKDIDRLAKDITQEELKDLKDKMRLDVGGDVEIPDSAALPLKSLDDKIREKLMGSKRVSGGGSSGGDEGKDGGPGGFGHDPTRARGLRWVLQFDTRTGRDYLNQLAAMKATLLVPAPDGKKMYLFRDLANPKMGPVASDADLDGLSNQIQFSDIKQAAVEAVCEALGVRGYTPSAFWAFFPKDVERMMADKEVAYRNKRPEDIRQTKFKVAMRGGAFDLIVVDQQFK